MAANPEAGLDYGIACLCNRQIGNGALHGSTPASIGEGKTARVKEGSFRHVRPERTSTSEFDVALIDATGQRVFAPDISHHLAAGLTQRLKKRIVKFSDLDVLVLAELLEGFCIVSVGLSEQIGVFAVYHRGDRIAVLRRQTVPTRLIDTQRESRARFMEARVVVELRDLVQAKRHVEPRANPFTGVYRAGFERSRDLASRQVDDHGAQSPQHLPAQAWHPVFQSD